MGLSLQFVFFDLTFSVAAEVLPIYIGSIVCSLTSLRKEGQPIPYMRRERAQDGPLPDVSRVVT